MLPPRLSFERPLVTGDTLARLGLDPPSPLQPVAFFVEPALVMNAVILDVLADDSLADLEPADMAPR